MPWRRNSGLSHALGPVLEQHDQDVAAAHQVDGAAAEVAAVSGSGKLARWATGLRHLAHRAGRSQPVGGLRLAAEADAAFPPRGQVGLQAVGGELHVITIIATRDD